MGISEKSVFAVCFSRAVKKVEQRVAPFWKRAFWVDR